MKIKFSNGKELTYLLPIFSFFSCDFNYAYVRTE